jgi:hypothetical protein
MSCGVGQSVLQARVLSQLRMEARCVRNQPALSSHIALGYARLPDRSRHKGIISVSPTQSAAVASRYRSPRWPPTPCRSPPRARRTCPAFLLRACVRGAWRMAQGRFRAWVRADGGGGGGWGGGGGVGWGRGGGARRPGAHAEALTALVSTRPRTPPTPLQASA